MTDTKKDAEIIQVALLNATATIVAAIVRPATTPTIAAQAADAEIPHIMKLLKKTLDGL